MAVAWPASLPQFSLYYTRKMSYESAVSEFQPAVGPPIRRKRQTSSRMIFGGVYRFTSIQLDEFWDFYNTTIDRGVDEFTMWNPHKGEYSTVKFLSSEPPSASSALRDLHDMELVFRVSA